MTRDLVQEMDVLKNQMAELQELVYQALMERKPASASNQHRQEIATAPTINEANPEAGSVFYSGRVHLNGQSIRWEPQERRMDQLLDMNTEKAAKILAALGNKQRLDILKAVMAEPLSGSELVERLNMGTTGQLYHHLKALLGADLLVQEQGGRYALPKHRSLPFLLLLSAAGDLLDTSDYLEMSEARNNAGMYFGSSHGFDIHQLLWAVVENSILEHTSGYGDQISIFLHEDGSVSVTDNGRGIPVQALPNSDIPVVQSILTDVHRLNASAHFLVPGAERGISIAVVNALSKHLTVEIRRDGNIYRQEYRHGIPQTGLLIVGMTQETGTSVTFKPEPELFSSAFEFNRIIERKSAIAADYPGLNLTIRNTAE
ncbi:ATP-binding protein [Paenibacillus lautus]|uniref:ATP-binding protein n=1 Tax=Paenibacillus lautus TaxID=1401 RepID=UPI002DB95D96|nr:ATP-binding protein [Paenibacillus lautus]MEC0307241.1 ATP-binding protein [Paenibacillus lautus]